MTNSSAICVFFVSKAEYSKLQAAYPRAFPYEYREFVRRIELRVAGLSKNVIVERIDVNVDDFLAWCIQQKRVPDRRARADYAAAVGSKADLN